MTPKGVLWHSTGANNPNLKRYVQPSDTKPAEDSYSKDQWLAILGKNQYNNDWNHIERQAGLNCWIGKLADGTVTAVQTMPWDYRPWGCGSGSKGSCNSGWMQFEICEDSLTNKDYFEAVYREACEITAYYCKMYNIDPKGTVVHEGVTVPTILCHYDSYKLGLGSNHGDVDHWFKKFGKTMDTVREDVAKLLAEESLKEVINMNSNLVTYKNLTNNCTKPRNHVLDTLTPHVVVGQFPAKWIVDYFTDPSLEASCNYAIGTDGDIALGVEESNRSWCTSSRENDHRAITVEIASDKTDPYAITDKAYAALIDLFTDICKRYGKTKVIWKPDKDYMLNYAPAENEMRITVHRWFANKSCPGPYLYERLTDVANEINKRLADANKTEEPQMYRVRKSWSDAKSQKGAYKILENAKKCCDAAGEGYKVYDNSGTEVYAYAAPVEEPKEETPVVAVYDLDYPDKVKIIDNTIQRTNMDCAKAIKKILSNNPTFDIEIAKTFFNLAPKYQIDPLMAIAQSILETGWFKYEQSAVTPDQHNYCGMGVVTNGIKGASFDTIEDGVTAQLQHLFAYGCKIVLPNDEEILDPRFSLVTRSVATYWQQLAGRWACPGYDTTKYAIPADAMAAGNTYGQKIRNIYDRLVATEVTEEEINNYFPAPALEVPKTEEPKTEEPTETQPSVTEQPDTESGETKATNLAVLIFSVIRKLLQMFVDLFNKK
jgi:N-acetyl-anhydromuramyl-L-alanine amidase AmpD